MVNQKNPAAKALLKRAYGDTDSIDYDLFKSAGILIEHGEFKALELLLQEADSAPRDEIRKIIDEANPNLFKSLYQLEEGQYYALAQSKILPPEDWHDSPRKWNKVHQKLVEEFSPAGNLKKSTDLRGPRLKWKN